MKKSKIKTIDDINKKYGVMLPCYTLTMSFKCSTPKQAKELSEKLDQVYFKKLKEWCGGFAKKFKDSKNALGIKAKTIKSECKTFRGVKRSPYASWESKPGVNSNPMSATEFIHYIGSINKTVSKGDK